MSSTIDLYETLKKHLHAEAAEMITDVLMDRSDLVTKADLKAELAAFRSDMQAEFKSLESRMNRNMLLFFVPMWLGTWGALIAFLLRR